MTFLPYSISMPFHQYVLEGFFNQVSLIHSEIDKTGVVFSMKSFFSPTFTNMLFVIICDLVVPGLLVGCCVTVHLVHTNADLLHARKVDQSRVPASLFLNLTNLVITFRNGCCRARIEIAIAIEITGIQDHMQIDDGMNDDEARVKANLLTRSETLYTKFRSVSSTASRRYPW